MVPIVRFEVLMVVKGVIVVVGCDVLWTDM
jgi:hypothetical protein